MNGAELKNLVRSKALKKRDKIAEYKRNIWSGQIMRRMLALDEIDKARSLFCYVSMASEVDTFGLIKALIEKNKQVAVPKITDYSAGIMQPCLISSLDNLKKNKLGALEPIQNIEADNGKNSFDIVIAPGAAFTKTGERLGMGAGFYDRYLSAHKTRKIIAPCFELQIAEDLPHEKHDVPMDMLVTENAVIKCK